MSFHPAMTSGTWFSRSIRPSGVYVRPLLTQKVELPVAAAPESIGVMPVRPKVRAHALVSAMARCPRRWPPCHSSFFRPHSPTSAAPTGLAPSALRRPGQSGSPKKPNLQPWAPASRDQAACPTGSRGRWTDPRGGPPRPATRSAAPARPLGPAPKRRQWASAGP